MNETGASTGASPDLTGLISSLLSSPESLSKLSGIISKYTNSENGVNSPPSEHLGEFVDDNDTTNANINAEPPTSSPTEENSSNAGNRLDLSKIASIFSSNSSGKSQKNKEQTALLLAIRPYLSPRRQELIDSFIKISQLGEILQKFN